MVMLQATLVALLWTAAAEPFYLVKPFGNITIPGWLPNIFNPLVRTTFPEANAWYKEHYMSNYTFDGTGKNHSLPNDPLQTVPLIPPPPKRTVEPLFPKPVNLSLPRTVKNPAVNMSSNATSMPQAPPSAVHDPSLPGNGKRKLDLLKKTFGKMFQAMPIGTLASGQQLQQGIQLFSTDQAVFLVVQGDGNLVLYNSALYAEYGAVVTAAIWASGTNGQGPAPLVLSMQTDCNLVLYAANGNAVWASATYTEGTGPCSLIVSSASGGFISVQDSTGIQLYKQPLTAATSGMWRTPHPDPDPLNGPPTGLSGASAIAMAYVPDGTVIFAERPHAIAGNVPNNPLLVNANDVGALGSVYTVSYYGQDIPNEDTFTPLNVQSQPFCVGVAVDYEGNAILVGGDNQGVGTIFRSDADKAANLPFPNGYYDVRRYEPGAEEMTIPDSMYDVNSMTGAPNTARDCCLQLPTDPVAIPDTCVPDENCSPRWYPTLLTLPSGNIIIVGGCLVTSGNGEVATQNPTWQIYNVAAQSLTYNTPFPTDILIEQVPYSLYPLMWVLPGTGSILVLDGVAGEVLETDGDTLGGLDARYTNPPDTQWPMNWPTTAASVLLPLIYPDYTPEVLIMGGADDSGNGLAYSKRLSGLVPGQTAEWQQEAMGIKRIEGVGVLLPDGTVFLCSGASYGYVGGSFDSDNAYSGFATRPQIYSPTAAQGQRWSNPLTDSGIDRGYHNSALLIASGEASAEKLSMELKFGQQQAGRAAAQYVKVMVAGSEPTGEYRVQYYVPGYLLRGHPQPLITNAPAQLKYDAQFVVSYDLAGDTIKSVVLIRTSGSTHSVQMDQRMIVLNTQVASSTSLMATAPPDGTVAPPGFYMLFLVSTLGTPSVANFVYLPPSGGGATPVPTPVPNAGTLASGQNLQEGRRLFSADNSVFLLVQQDGNLVLYNTALYTQYGLVYQAAIWSSGTVGSVPAPFELSMQQDCNLVLYNGNIASVGLNVGAAVWSSGTYDQGTAPCLLTVSGPNGGSISVSDATGMLLFQQPQNGVLYSNQQLQQGVRLYSADKVVFLIVQADGNLVLYNSAEYAQDSAVASAAIWSSGTDGSNPAPFLLHMQLDCNLVLYNANGQAPADAIFSTETQNNPTPCSLSLSSNGRGSISVIDANEMVLYTQPK